MSDLIMLLTDAVACKGLGQDFENEMPARSTTSASCHSDRTKVDKV